MPHPAISSRKRNDSHASKQDSSTRIRRRSTANATAASASLQSTVPTPTTVCTWKNIPARDTPSILEMRRLLCDHPIIQEKHPNVKLWNKDQVQRSFVKHIAPMDVFYDKSAKMWSLKKIKEVAQLSSDQKDAIKTETTKTDVTMTKANRSTKNTGSEKKIEQESTGCRICGTNQNEDQILLCEACDAEYHFYCLQPPLKEIPSDEWYCAKCVFKNRAKTTLPSPIPTTTNTNMDIDLEFQVAALPPSITSRYGEIVWAQGGPNYGWWPALIYDPRQTVEPARSQARRCLRTKHLCYFYQCQECPFSILPERTKIKDWWQGMAEDFHLGKAARSHGKQRFMDFQRALEVACMEMEKTVHERLDWDHTVASTTTDTTKLQQNRKTRSEKFRQISCSSGGAASHSLTVSGTSQPVSFSRSKRKRQQDRTSSKDKRQSVVIRSNNDFTDTVPLFPQPQQDERMYVCQIKTCLEMTALETIVSQQISTNIVGFVILKGPLVSFADAREHIQNNLVGDVLPANIQWHFYLPKLGPIAHKQEATISVLPQIVDTTNNTVGTMDHPVELYLLMQDRNESKTNIDPACLDHETQDWHQTVNHLFQLHEEKKLGIHVKDLTTRIGMVNKHIDDLESALRTKRLHLKDLEMELQIVDLVPRNNLSQRLVLTDLCESNSVSSLTKATTSQSPLSNIYKKNIEPQGFEKDTNKEVDDRKMQAS